MDPEACLEAAQNAKETRKKIYGYENLGVAKVNDYLNIDVYKRQGYRSGRYNHHRYRR